MAKNTSVALGKHFESFIGIQVGKGRFAPLAWLFAPDCCYLKNTKLNLMRFARR
jgi:hypothetical protein